MFSGCKQEDLLTSEAAVSDGPRFHGATEEFNADTKTALGQNNSVVWSLNDELAISATIEDNGSLGLMYQWGRKDPIIGAYQILNEKDIARSYGREWTYVKSDASIGTIGYTVQNPTTFITKSSGSNDWLYGTHDSTRWGSEKTIYDPCPPGWRVPDGGPDGFWDKAGLTRQITGNRSEVGMIVPVTYCSSESWWPAIGRYTTTIESLSSIKNYGYYWTASSKSEKEAYRF